MDVYSFRDEDGEMAIRNLQVYADVSHFLDPAFAFSAERDQARR